jgi:hypothetical protein
MSSNPHQGCSVCTSPVRADIDRRLGEGISFTQLAAETGISRSSLHRHKTHAYKERITAEKEKNNPDLTNRRVITRMPDGRFIVSTTYGPSGTAVNHSGPAEYILESDLRPSDILLSFNFKSHPIKNPRGASADDVRHLADIENAQRNANKPS